MKPSAGWHCLFSNKHRTQNHLFWLVGWWDLNAESDLDYKIGHACQLLKTIFTAKSSSSWWGDDVPKWCNLVPGIINKTAHCIKKEKNCQQRSDGEERCGYTLCYQRRQVCSCDLEIFHRATAEGNTQWVKLILLTAWVSGSPGLCWTLRVQNIDLKLLILLPSPSESQDYSRMPPHPFS